ncbi:hypothetical protein SEPCBS57363_005549 [Sporothrix epigloea]|uniref:Uncharacterized protein n=1 Tax=Sporothrix epigloea TaxID=1892477 RepID=A0ABP0E224_9PEZI
MTDHSVEAANAPAFQPSVGDDEASAPAPPVSSSPAQPEKSERLSRTTRTHPSYPDPGSLFDILRENNSLSLFVLPIVWTDAHSRLLGARFIIREPILKPTLPSCSGGRSDVSPHGSSTTLYRPNETAEALSYDLTSLLSRDDTRPFSKSRAIKNVLSTLFKSAFSRPKSAAELDLHFGDRIYRSVVRVPVLWENAETVDSCSFDSAATRPISSFGHAPNATRETDDSQRLSSVRASQDASDGPIVAFVNRSQLSSIRKNLFRIVPGPEGGDRYNTPVSRLQGLRSKQLIPAELDQDSYLTSVFVAMAQSHFYERAKSRVASQAYWWSSRLFGDRVTRVLDFHDLKLRIITHDEKTSEFIVYTAVVTAAFLRRFLEPLKAAENVQEQAGLNIEYTRVSVWPILGLRERLGEALGRDLVGELEDATKLFTDEANQSKIQDDAGDKTDEMADKADSNNMATKRTVEDTDADHAAHHQEVQEVTESLCSQEEFRRFKRKRIDNISVPGMMSVSFTSESESSVNGAVGDHSSGVTVDTSPAAAAAVTILSPTLSPRKKRHHTRRSLSTSSLAVF